MQDFMFRLSSAIASAEGYFVAGALPQVNNNPGDLRAAPATPSTTQSMNKGFVKFTDIKTGISALYHQLALDIARGCSLRKLIYTYAPPTDYNNSELYLIETLRRLGLDQQDSKTGKYIWIDTPLQEFLEITHIP
jgi:hypothetical protein